MNHHGRRAVVAAPRAIVAALALAILLSLWPTLSATAQRVLQADTIFRVQADTAWEIYLVGVEGDTVVWHSGIDTSRYTFRSVDGGRTIEQHPVDLFLEQSNQVVPRRGTVRTHLHRYVNLAIARDGFTFSVFPSRANNGPSSAIWYVTHPTRPETTFAKSSFQPDRPFDTYDTLFVRTSDALPWTRMRLPDHRAGGLDKRVTLHFDYHRPERLWLTLDAETRFAENWTYMDEVFFSDDLGASWTYVGAVADIYDRSNPFTAMDSRNSPEMGHAIGLFKPDWIILHFDWNYPIPVLGNILTGEKDTLKQLIPFMDSLLGTDRSGKLNATYMLPQFIHPDEPGMVLFRCAYDTLIQGKLHNRFINVLTLDGGQSWFRFHDVDGSFPADVEYTSGLSDDRYMYSRTSQCLYTTYRKDKRNSLGQRIAYERGILRIPLGQYITSVAGHTTASPAQVSLQAWPNPSSDLLSISSRTPEVSLDGLSFQLVDALGRVVATPADFSVSPSTATIDIRGLPQGPYRLVATSGTMVTHVPCIIQR